MQSSRAFLGQATTVLKRHSYPPLLTRSYKGAHYRNPNNLRTEDNIPLTQHETTHALILSDDQSTALGLLTSAKKT
jgi:hypothetical protein